MSDRKISIRIGMEGGAEVTRGIDDITRAGGDGFDRMAASWGKVGDAAEKYKAQLAGVAKAAQEAANADEVNRSWSQFLGINNQVTNSAREAASAFQAGKTQTVDWSTAMSSAARIAGTFGVALSAAGAVEFARSTIESVAQIENEARALGVSVDALQAYHAAAVLSGAGADVGDAAIRRFTRSLGDAQAGSTLQADALRQLGVYAYELGDGSESLLPRVAASLLSISDASQRARLETELFGKAGQDVELVLQKWADPELIAHMNELGLTIDKELVQRAADLDKAWGTFWLHFKSGLADVLLGGQQIRAQQQLIDEHYAGSRQVTSGLTAAGNTLAQSAGKAVVSQELLDVLVTPAQFDIAGERDKIAIKEAELEFAKDKQRVEDEADQKAAERLGRMQDELALAKQRNEIDAEWKTNFLDKLLESAQHQTTQDLLKGVAGVSREQLAPDREAAKQALEDARAFDQLFRPMYREFDSFLLSVEQTGKLSFGRLFGSILTGWEEMLNKMITQQLFQSLFGSLVGSGFSAGFGGLFGGGAPVVDYHSGGVAGEGTPKRMMPWSTFSTAPRYHMGIDEVPAVLLKGERVLNRQQAKAWNGSGGSQNVNLRVSVDVSGARGSQEITDAVNQGVTSALTAYRQNALAADVQPIVRRAIKDPRFNG